MIKEMPPKAVEEVVPGDYTHAYLYKNQETTSGNFQSTYMSRKEGI